MTKPAVEGEDAVAAWREKEKRLKRDRRNGRLGMTAHAKRREGS